MWEARITSQNLGDSSFCCFLRPGIHLCACQNNFFSSRMYVQEQHHKFSFFPLMWAWVLLFCTVRVIHRASWLSNCRTGCSHLLDFYKDISNVTTVPQIQWNVNHLLAYMQTYYPVKFWQQGCSCVLLWLTTSQLQYSTVLSWFHCKTQAAWLPGNYFFPTVLECTLSYLDTVLCFREFIICHRQGGQNFGYHLLLGAV